MLDKIEILKKYNFWYNEINNLGFIRGNYLNKLKESIGISSLIKVILGQRRVGKSFLLKQLINLLIKDKGVNPKNIFYLNLEYDDFSFIKNKDDLRQLILLYLDNLKPKGKVYLII